jgi:ketosteroid isomerase-like protein
MSQENVEIVRVAYDAFAREGLDRFMEHFTDDVDYGVLAGADDLIHGSIQGKDGVRACSRTGSICSTGSGWSWWN